MQFLMIVSLLLGDFAVYGQASRKTALKAPLQRSMNGTIVLGGGYFDDGNTAALLERMIDLAGGPGISLVIIPTADAQLEPATRAGSSTALIDYEKAARVAFAHLGVKSVTVLHTRDRSVADSEAFLSPLRSANCVWVPGGDPELLFAIYPNTRVTAELQGVLNRGGIVAGDSAGAMVLGQGWLAIDLDHPEKTPAVLRSGLDLLQDAFVMAHANRYKPGVLARGSTIYLSGHPEAVSILIDEHTSIMIQRSQIARLTGNGRAGVVDGSRGTDAVVWLSGSARYDLRSRALVQ